MGIGVAGENEKASRGPSCSGCTHDVKLGGRPVVRRQFRSFLAFCQGTGDGKGNESARLAICLFASRIPKFDVLPRGEANQPMADSGRRGRNKNHEFGEPWNRHFGLQYNGRAVLFRRPLHRFQI